MKITPQKYFFELWLAVEDDLVVVHPTPVPAAFLMHSELMIFVPRKFEDNFILLDYQILFCILTFDTKQFVIGNFWGVQDLDLKLRFLL